MQIANSSTKANGGQAGAYARGVLILNGASDYKEPVYLPDVMVNRKLKTNNKLPETDYINVYPNPADKYVTVEYKIETESENLVLKVSDAGGRNVFVRKLAFKEDSLLIDIEDFVPSSYVVYIEIGGKIVDSKVIAVTK